MNEDESNEHGSLETWALKIVHRVSQNIVADNFETGGRYESMKKIERTAIIRAGIAGMISGLLCSIATLVAAPLLVENPASWTENILYFSIIGVTSGIVTILEIAFLYWDAIKNSAKMISIAQKDRKKPYGMDHVNISIVRSALEIPNSKDQLFGIDPLREKSNTLLFIQTIAYKAKIAVSNFVIKALIRRLMGRAASRAYIEFISIPVFGLWNAMITKWIMFEARLRAIGPFCIEEFYAKLYPEGLEKMSLERAQFEFIVMSEKVVQSGSFHPNVFIFLNRFITEVPYTVEELSSVSIPEAIERLDISLRKDAMRCYFALVALEGGITKSDKKNLSRLEALGMDIPYKLQTPYLNFVLNGEELL